MRDIDKGRLAVEEKEVLNREQLMMEAIYLGLRMTDGIHINVFDQKFNVRFNELFNDIIADLKEKEFIKVAQNRCALTKKGMLFQESITSMFICKEM